MERIKGYDYTIEINDNTEGFALSILQLVNIRSSRPNVIHDVRTIEGTNMVKITTYEELDDFLSRYKIVHKENIVILDVNYDDYNIKTRKELENLDQDYFDEKIEEFYVGHELI